MMQAIKGMFIIIALVFALVAAPQRATAISSATGPEPWGEFGFIGPVGSFAFRCIPPLPDPVPAGSNCIPSDGNNSFFLGDPPWTFTGSGFLIVQDAFDIGDQFKVFDNGIDIGNTSTPIGTGDCGSDPDACFLDNNVSKGIFALADGAHSFAIQWIASPFADGTAFLCVSTSDASCSPVSPVPAPEPSSLLLLAIALVGAWGWSKRAELGNCYIVLRRKPRRP